MQKGFYLRYLILVCLVVGNQICGFSESYEDAGSPHRIEYRNPPYNQIEAFQENPAYKYDREGERPGLLQRLLVYLFQLFLGRAEGVSWFRYVLLGGVVFLIVSVVMRMMNVPFSWLFVFKRKGVRAGFDSEMHAGENYEEELHKMYSLYRENGAYREAIRILYLLYLKKMEKDGFLRIRSWKTNREYFQEISNKDRRAVFFRLSRIYEYVWFGHFEPALEKFDEIEVEFKKCID